MKKNEKVLIVSSILLTIGLIVLVKAKPTKEVRFEIINPLINGG